MPVGISDFMTLPKWAKYIILIAIILGASIEIPFTGLLNIFSPGQNVSVGDIFFFPFSFALSFIGIAINFKEFAILIILGIVILAMITIQQGAK